MGSEAVCVSCVARGGGWCAFFCVGRSNGMKSGSEFGSCLVRGVRLRWMVGKQSMPGGLLDGRSKNGLGFDAFDRSSKVPGSSDTGSATRA